MRVDGSQVARSRMREERRRDERENSPDRTGSIIWPCSGWALSTVFDVVEVVQNGEQSATESLWLSPVQGSWSSRDVVGHQGLGTSHGVEENKSRQATVTRHIDARKCGWRQNPRELSCTEPHIEAGVERPPTLQSSLLYRHPYLLIPAHTALPIPRDASVIATSPTNALHPRRRGRTNGQTPFASH
jgi:hypothetical protein